MMTTQRWALDDQRAGSDGKCGKQEVSSKRMTAEALGEIKPLNIFVEMTLFMTILISSVCKMKAV